MGEIMLVHPALSHQTAAELYIEEHHLFGEYELMGCSQLYKLPYPSWLKHLENCKDIRTVSPNWVVSDTYFAVRESDGRLIGTVDVRHTLSAFLRNYGGHIGYGVRPTERHKGYATQMLRLALGRCREIGLERALLVCDTANLASSSTIKKCGGILETESVHPDGSPIQLYWINV